MTNHSEPAGVTGEAKITLRTAGELAEALPYLLGFRPDDSIVLVALHQGRFGGRVRLGIPDRAEDWPSVAHQMARCLIGECERRDGRPDSVVAFLCQDAAALGTDPGRHVADRLRPLAQLLRTACGGLDVPVTEALCLSDGRYWSYCCPRPECCPPEGNVIVTGGTSVMAATAAYAGIHVRASAQEVRGRLAPLQTALVAEQTRALDAAAMDLVPRIFAGVSREEVEAETLDLARRVMRRFADVPGAGDVPGEGNVSGAGDVPGEGNVPGADTALDADLKDDELLAHDEAATLILGLQDRDTRDRAAEWMEGPEASCALRLWRALARRCVGPYAEHAAAPLTLAGWVAWSLGDTVEADQALEMALTADPRYVFARLLNAARADGIDPEPVRRSLRGKRAGREAESVGEGAGVVGVGVAEGAGGIGAGLAEGAGAVGAVLPDGISGSHSMLPGKTAGGTETVVPGNADDAGQLDAGGVTEEDPVPEEGRTSVPRQGGAVDPGVSRAARGLEAALRRRGEYRHRAGTRPSRAGTHAPRRPAGTRRVGRPRTRDDG
ncbi:DUF4192 domain-containing protein [Streptomyces sp. NPDC049813]|uniref:DUF4192 domain-containing protein n=1 Tax=Streptomyces sp. NPDC049813 TaxID=3365597 RepID=UPI0037A2F089